ncbi:hypothetical protein BJX76DRAFT_365552 [Aspergillus varians]
MHLRISILGLAVARLALAAEVGYFDSKTCADPSGLESCYEDTDSSWADCINDNCDGLGVDCHNVCECIRQEAYLNCAASSCWNKVYSCEYQSTASDLIGACLNPPINSIPFFPPPDNAPGGCSCNIGTISIDTYLASANLEDCNAENIEGMTDEDELASYAYGCMCCSYSTFLSSLPNTCPTLDPSELELDNLEQIFRNVSGSDWDDCAQYLEQYDCAKTFGYPDHIETYYGPGEIPTGGTETLHNTAGSITSPVSGATFTWTSGTVENVVTVSSVGAVPTGGGDDDDDDTDTASATSSGGSGGGSESTATDESQPGLGVRGVSVHPVLIAVAGGMMSFILVL